MSLERCTRLWWRCVGRARETWKGKGRAPLCPEAKTSHRRNMPNPRRAFSSRCASKRVGWLNLLCPGPGFSRIGSGSLWGLVFPNPASRDIIFPLDTLIRCLNCFIACTSQLIHPGQHGFKLLLAGDHWEFALQLVHLAYQHLTIVMLGDGRTTSFWNYA